MKAILLLLKIVVMLVIGVLVVGLFLPTEWECSRTIIVDGSAAEIEPLVSDLRRWDEWSAWNSREDPSMKITYSGAPSGEGAIEEWTSDKMGAGRLEITQASLEGLEYSLTFKDMPQTINGSFHYAPAGEGTEITWKCWGTSGDMPWDTVMSQVFVPLIGSDFQAGLEGIKGAVEGTAN